MHLEGAHGGDENGDGRVQPGLAALDVEEFLGAEIGPESRFRDHEIGELEGCCVAITELQPWAMLAKGPP